MLVGKVPCSAFVCKLNLLTCTPSPHTTPVQPEQTDTKGTPPEQDQPLVKLALDDSAATKSHIAVSSDTAEGTPEGNAVVGLWLDGETLGELGNAELGAIVLGTALDGCALLGRELLGRSVDGRALLGQDVDGTAELGDAVVGCSLLGTDVEGHSELGTPEEGVAVLGKTVDGSALLGHTLLGDAVTTTTLLGSDELGDALLGVPVGTQVGGCVGAVGAAVVGAPDEGVAVGAMQSGYVNTPASSDRSTPTLNKLHRLEGSRPVRLFELRYNCVSDVSTPKELGTVPARLFLRNTRYFARVNKPRVEGI